MGEKRVVIDTNNLISAIGWEGNSRNLLRKAINKEYELIISVKQIEELKRVMDYPKFKFDERQKKKFLEMIFEISTVIDAKTELKVADDKNDDMLIECAIEGKADFIISGDDDLLRLKEFKSVKIVSVRDFLESKN